MLTDDEIIAIRKNVSTMCLDYSKPYVDTLRFAREIEEEVRYRLDIPRGAVTIREVIARAEAMPERAAALARARERIVTAEVRSLLERHEGHDPAIRAFLATPPAGA